MRIKNNNKGFTIIELTAAIAVFFIITVIATTSFAQSLRNYHAVAGLMTINNNMSLAIEYMMREIRTATDIVIPNMEDDGTGDELQFINSRGEEVAYYVFENSIVKQTGTTDPVVLPLTASDIEVRELNFHLNTTGEDVDAEPYLITISMLVGSTDPTLSNVTSRIQTAVSKRSLNL